MAISQKRTRSPSSSPGTPATPSKKPRVFPPTTPGKERPAAFVNRILESNSRPVSSNVRPRQVEYSSLEQFWMVFGDPQSLQFLRSAANLEEYNRYIKYFHGRLVLVVRGLHLPEVEAIFCNFFPAWHGTSDTDIQDAMEYSSEAAYEWANAEVVKKIQAYCRAWFDSPAGQEYITAWVKANKSHTFLMVMHALT